MTESDQKKNELVDLCNSQCTDESMGILLRSADPIKFIKSQVEYYYNSIKSILCNTTDPNNPDDIFG